MPQLLWYFIRLNGSGINLSMSCSRPLGLCQCLSIHKPQLLQLNTENNTTRTHMGSKRLWYSHHVYLVSYVINPDFFSWIHLFIEWHSLSFSQYQQYFKIKTTKEMKRHFYSYTFMWRLVTRYLSYIWNKEKEGAGLFKDPLVILSKCK